jgi:hypothetical protein
VGGERELRPSHRPEQDGGCRLVEGRRSETGSEEQFEGGGGDDRDRCDVY